MRDGLCLFLMLRGKVSLSPLKFLPVMGLVQTVPQVKDVPFYFYLTETFEFATDVGFVGL